MAIDLNQQANFTQPLFRFLRQQRENRRFMDGIEVAVTFFTISLFGIFAIGPTLTTISSLVGENKAKETSISTMKTKINNIVKAQDNFVKIQDDFLLIESSLPDSPSYGDAATQIEGISKKTGWTLDKINYNLSKDPLLARLPTDNFSVTFANKNTFATTNQLINNLLKNRRLLDVSVINFVAPTQTAMGPDGKIDVNITLNFLNFKKK